MESKKEKVKRGTAGAGMPGEKKSTKFLSALNSQIFKFSNCFSRQTET
jgi:hypothetical protein